MNGRRRWLWLAVLALLVMLLGLWQDKRQKTSPAAPPAPKERPAPMVDLTRHDGQTIDFSSGQPVVKDTAADRAALKKAEKEMEAAAGNVTFKATKPAAPEPEKSPTK